MINGHIPGIVSVFILLLIISIFPAGATIFLNDGSNLTPSELYTLTNETKPDNTTSPVVFFYDPECGSCGPAHEYIEKYLSNHTESNLTIINLSADRGAEVQLNNYYSSYKREFMYIPVVFIGPVGLEGTEEIISGFENVYNWYKK
jgi:glutaredoxin